MCIPTQEELKKRTEDRKKEGIELPENAVSDMKSKGQEIHCFSYLNNIPIFVIELLGKFINFSSLLRRIYSRSTTEEWC